MSLQMKPDMLKDWKILVVDDEPDNLLLMVILFEEYGATILEAENGKIGLELARREKPDFILADLSMPVVNGWQMLYHLKRDDTLKAIPVIAVTAHVMKGDRETVMNAGFAGYKGKPINSQTFVREILSILAEVPATAARIKAIRDNINHIIDKPSPADEDHSQNSGEENTNVNA